MNKSKTFMTVSIATLIIAIIASTVTYAWYTWSTTSENETKIVTSLGAARVFFDTGANIVGANLRPTATKEEGIVKNITVKTSKSATYKISFNLYLDVISLDPGLQHASFKYALYQEGVTDAVASGNFLNATLEPCETNNTSHIELVMDKAITTTTSEYKLYIWIDGTMDNPESMQSQNFNFKLHADGQNAVIGETLLQHINNLYTPNTTKENNGITYNLDTTNYLMNDRLGTMSVGIDNGNIRYYGASPNNYIDIGDIYDQDTVINNWEEIFRQGDVPETMIPTNSDDCKQFVQCSNLVPSLFEDEDTCKAQLPYLIQQTGFSNVNELCSTTLVPTGTTKALYRIIGLFKDVELADGTKKDLIKVVRNTRIGRYSWDQSPSDINEGRGINEWSQADLMKLLNPDHGDETVGGSLYWNSGSGNCYAWDYTNGVAAVIPCDFSKRGLSTNARNNIETVKWNLGGWDTNLVYPNQIYEYERGTNVLQNPSDGIKRTTVWPGKVALAYPSDYGYATDLNSCSETLVNYENCTGSNWLYNPLTASGGSGSWLLTPHWYAATYAWDVDADGNVDYYYVDDDGGVSPVFYLDSALGIVTGDGSQGNPYVVR